VLVVPYARVDHPRALEQRPEEEGGELAIDADRFQSGLGERFGRRALGVGLEDVRENAAELIEPDQSAARERLDLPHAHGLLPFRALAFEACETLAIEGGGHEVEGSSSGWGANVTWHHGRVRRSGMSEQDLRSSVWASNVSTRWESKITCRRSLNRLSPERPCSTSCRINCLHSFVIVALHGK
jgi:hypothetical protein